MEQMLAVIDIGSNTMRLSIYQWKQEGFRIMIHKKEMVGLASYVEDGRLSDSGILSACNVMKEFRKIVESIGVENVLVFATASLRNISNTKEAVIAIEKQSGYQVEVISGEEEARLDFVGAMYKVDLKEGLLVDIGGGSTELVPFSDKKPIATVSMDIGSLSLYTRFVKKILPKKEELEEMKEAAQKGVEDVIGDIKLEDRQRICGVGGTIRALLKLCNYIYHKDAGNTVITGEEVKELYEMLCDKKAGKWRAIFKVCPDRIHTMIPGITILQAIVKKYHVTEVIVSGYGVREGYLVEHIG